MKKQVALLLFVGAFLMLATQLVAQDIKPEDNGIFTYHTAPRYRPSEEHPLRLLAYVVHPIGWVARELVTRPISAFTSGGEFRKSFFGFREPYDYRKPECFSGDPSVPDCRAVAPFNYESATTAETTEVTEPAALVSQSQIYFPDVNFNFDKRQVNDLGRGRAHQIADALKNSNAVNVVLEGHTDYVGSAAYNDKLGMDRAQAVKQELIALGVPAEKIATVSFGKTRPILKDEKPWAAAVNRRVEVHFK